jgi:hypothetical protein
MKTILTDPGTLYRDSRGRVWVVVSDEARTAAVAPLAPVRPAMAGDVEIRSGGAIRTSAVRLAVPAGDWIGCISEIERQLAIREAERVAETRRVVAKQAPLAGGIR